MDAGVSSIGQLAEQVADEALRPFESPDKSIRFAGGDEPENHETFKARAERDGLFTVYHECWGWYVGQRPRTKPQRPRIDFIIVPSQRVIDTGWDYGAVGVEAKAKDKRLGPAIAQAIDYSYSVFETPLGLIMPSAVFLYPVNATVYNEAASVMQQFNIGTISNVTGGTMFMLGQTGVLRAYLNGEISGKNLRSGRKVGSR